MALAGGLDALHPAGVLFRRNAGSLGNGLSETSTISTYDDD